MTVDEAELVPAATVDGSAPASASTPHMQDASVELEDIRNSAVASPMFTTPASQTVEDAPPVLMSAIDGIPSVPEIGVLVGEPMEDIVDELLDMSTTPAPPIVTDEPPLLLSTTDAAAVHTTASMGATDAPPYKLTASPLPEVAVTPAVAVIDTSANC